MAELDTSAPAGPATPHWPERVARSPIAAAKPVTVVDGDRKSTV